MAKYFNRIWSIAVSLSLLASAPAFGDMPAVPPLGGGNDTAVLGPQSAGDQSHPRRPGTDTAQGPGDGGQSGPGASQDSGSANSSVVNTVKQPTVLAQGAVVMDAATGELIYSRQADTKFYPASITKLMTALLVAEKCNPDDTVTFSKTAVTNLESGAVTLGLVAGDRLTVRQSLYGLLLKSANEVANGLAEHAAGSVGAFAAMMNAKAKELGCTNTNFVNPNGLNNSNHHTTPHDMALIARAAFQNATVRKVASTLSYQIPATLKAAARKISLGHKMLYPNDSRYYQGVIGGKTGYTSLAGNTLVTCAERDGIRLIAVVMKCKSSQYTDTAALLDYGFAIKKEGPQTAKWQQAGDKWNFIKSDGSKAENEWMTIDGAEYWFDTDGTMAAGWRHYSNDVWYYFKPSGAMAVNSWEKNGDQWFYVGADGAMLKNAVTPDGYQVDANGAWIE